MLFKKPIPRKINLIKNAKYHFLLLRKFQNTEIAQLWSLVTPSYTDFEIVQFPAHVCKVQRVGQALKKTNFTCTHKTLSHYPTACVLKNCSSIQFNSLFQFTQSNAIFYCLSTCSAQEKCIIAQLCSKVAALEKGPELGTFDIFYFFQ